MDSGGMRGRGTGGGGRRGEVDIEEFFGEERV